ECGPGQNLADRDRNRPGCPSLDKAVHVLPYRVFVCRSGKEADRVFGRVPESRTLRIAEGSVNAA
ncbi:MAG: hypothetical protein MN733_14145, partial [Nitrososphaera sp.]|nr:hypothetical protein [Nitrososphaera sp.]